MIAADLATELADICGRDGVVTERDRLLAYESDGLTAYRHRPGAVVLPRTTGDLRAAVKALSSRGVAIVPRGAGTGLSGGAVALGGAVVIGTARMNRILRMDPENRRVRVQPGVINAELSVAASPYGLHYAPDPSSQSACTIGGNVAENSGGPHCLKYGVTSRYVTGLSVVLADGSLVEFGGMGKEAGGYDLTGLFVGSEGCFGIAAEIEVGLVPLPEAVRTLLAVFGRLEDAGRAVTSIVGCGLLPAAMEIIDGATIRAVENSVFAAGYPTDAEAALVVEFDGMEAGMDADATRARQCCEDAGATKVEHASDEAERAALWRGRKKAFGAMGRIAPDLLVQDATVPRSALPDVLRRISRVAETYGLSVANVFHAGDGNLHPNILFDRSDPEEVARVEKASAEIMRLCMAAGGTITGEHGVGLDKKAYMPLAYGPEEIRLMWGLRRVFDPDGVLNPGKVLPDGTEPAQDAWRCRSSTEGRAEGEREDEDAASAAGASRRRSADASELRPVRPQRDAGAVAETLRLAGIAEEDVQHSAEGGAPWPPEVAAEAVVRPRSVDDVQAVVESANQTGASVLPAGGGTWLAPGGRVGRANIVLSTMRLNQVECYEPADLTITMGAGRAMTSALSIRNGVPESCRENLKADLEAHGQWLPLDSPGASAGTIGGLVATGTAGTLRNRYGAVRDNVLGVDAVTGDGRRIKFGGRVVKNVAGYDLVRLMTGSRGSLAVLVGVSVRVFPRPAADVTLIQCFRADEIAERARAVANGPAPVAALEIESSSPAHDWFSLKVRVVGAEAEVADGVARVLPLLGGARRQVRLEGPSSRDHHESAECWESGARLVVRLVARPSLLGSTLRLARALATDLGGSLVADALQGTARVKTAFPIDAGFERVMESKFAEDGWAGRLAEVRSAVEEMGGSLAVSQAPLELRERIPWTRETKGQALLADRLKALFDPHGVLPARRA